MKGESSGSLPKIHNDHVMQKKAPLQGEGYQYVPDCNNLGESVEPQQSTSTQMICVTQPTNNDTEILTEEIIHHQ